MQECKGGAIKALENFQNVKEKRLKEDINSAYRMKEVCDLIPDSVDGLDLELTGWHRKCNQSFIKNLDRLKSSINYRNQNFKDDLQGSQLLQHSYSSKKECLFCCRNRIKVKKDGTTKEELPDKIFVSWIHKHSGWENVAAMAEHMQHIGYALLWGK